MDERHLFILDKSLFETIPVSALLATWADIEYPSVNGILRFPLGIYHIWQGGKSSDPIIGDLEFYWERGSGTKVNIGAFVAVGAKGRASVPLHGPEHSYLMNVARLVLRLLCYSLTIQNIERQSRPGHALRTAKKSIKPARYTHVTTIRVPNVKCLPADEDHPPTGRSVRAHLRRGHARMQHHGPQNSLLKQVQIAPTFVKVDSDFVPGPKTYRLVGARNAEAIRSQPLHGTAGHAPQPDASNFRVGGRA